MVAVNIPNSSTGPDKLTDRCGKAKSEEGHFILDHQSYQDL